MDNYGYPETLVERLRSAAKSRREFHSNSEPFMYDAALMEEAADELEKIEKAICEHANKITNILDEMIKQKPS